MAGSQLVWEEQKLRWQWQRRCGGVFTRFLTCSTRGYMFLRRVFNTYLTSLAHVVPDFTHVVLAGAGN